MLKDKEVLDAKIAALEKNAIAPADQSEAVRRYVHEFSREQHVAIREKSCKSVKVALPFANVGFQWQKTAPSCSSSANKLMSHLQLTRRHTKSCYRDLRYCSVVESQCSACFGKQTDLTYSRELMESSVCSDPSDSLTSALSTLLDSFKDIIRSTHKASDLPEAVSALQTFMNDMLLTAKENPTPQGFFELCKNHQGDLHVFLHDLCANSPKLVDAYSQWYSDSIKLYHRTDDAPLGSFTKIIDDLLSSLNEKDRQTVLKEADDYATFSQSAEALSRERFQAILQGKSADMGPGTAIQIWHDYIDKSAVRPSTLDGKCRFGSDASVQDASGQSEELADGESSGRTQKVNVLPTAQGRPPVNGVKGLLEKFHKLLTQNRVISI